jgi:hypothetical protein
MEALFLFPEARRRDPAIDAWFAQGDALRSLVQPWYERLRDCGADVRDLIHDGRPTACVEEAAFAYVDAYATHANIGFFCGADLDDPAHLLEGTGKRMRHVKLRFNRMPDEAALCALLAHAYKDMRRRLDGPRPQH